MLKQINLRYRLIANFILPILLSGLIIYLGTQYLFRIFIDNTVPNLALIGQIGIASRTLQTETLEYIVTGEESTLTEIDDEDGNALNSLITELENRQASEPAITTLLQVVTNITAQSELIIDSHQETLSLMETFEALDNTATNLFQESDEVFTTQSGTATQLIYSDYRRLFRIVLLETAEFVALSEEDGLTKLAETQTEFESVSDQFLTVLELNGQANTTLIADYQAISQQVITLTNQIVASHQETIEQLERLEAIETNLEIALHQAEQLIAQTARQQARAATNGGLLLTVGTILVALWLGTQLTNRLSRPILSLVQTTEAIGEEMFEVALPPTNIVELDRLQLAIQKMATQLQTTISTMEQQVTDRTAALELAKTQAEEAQSTAEEANRAKSSFLANMSHELRTPLAAIIGYSELLTEQSERLGYEKFTPRLNKIQISANHLLDIISDILDISKIEAGQMDLFRETFKIHPLIDNVLVTANPLIEKNNNELILTYAPDLDEMYGDVTKVRQVLLNLLSNAAKFTENGRITITTNRQQKDGKAWLVCQISDTGVGMTAEQMSNIFDAFAQADASTSRKFGGTGLGLAISQRFCQMMGGHIEVESQKKQGSTFTIYLPLLTTHISATDPKPIPTTIPDPIIWTDRATLKILVIEDEPLSRDLIVSHLTAEGMDVKTAVDGKQGIDLAYKLKPDLIILDILMPEVDGWSVLSTLKSDETLADIPVIMLSILQEQAKGLALGASDYLLKPISGRQLRHTINKYRPLLNKNKPILIIDDNDDIRDYLQERLTQEGWAVQEANNGEAGLDSVQQTTPALILLDLMMPIMDGFTFLEQLPHITATLPPIIVLTAMSLTEADHARLKTHVEQIVEKGNYNIDTLLKEVHEMIKTRFN